MVWRYRNRGECIMTEEELESLCVHELTFETTDKNGKIRLWTTTYKFDHSFICDQIEEDDLEESEKILI
jgi:hypothetical protein